MENILKLRDKVRKLIVEISLGNYTYEDLQPIVNEISKLTNEEVSIQKCAQEENQERATESCNISDVNNWLPLPDKTGDWSDYEKAAENNCYIKFDDGSECRFDHMPWPFAVATHYKHV